MTVFVPRTAPGDLVQLTGIVRHARFARAVVAAVREPGPGRVPPRCVHYERDRCGGCQLQHLDLVTQLEVKRAIVADALARIGRLEVEVPPPVPAPEPWQYRSRITLTLGPGRRYAGFHPLDAPGRVFPLEQCHLAAAPLMDLWRGVEPLLHLLPADTAQLMLRVDRAGGLHLVVLAAGQKAWTDGPRLRTRLAERGVTATVWWHPEGGALRVVSGDREAVPAAVFEQVHPGMGDRIRAFAVAALGAVAGRRVWDLYAGIGETSEALHALGAEVESVELDARAVDVGERLWRAAAHLREESQRPERGVTRHQGRVEDLVATMHHPDAVIANPPRAGIARPVLDLLRARRPARIVYVSCDPATLARDLGVLCGTLTSSAEPSGRRAAEPPGYRLVTVQPFDLFPETAHVEAVAVLEA